MIVRHIAISLADGGVAIMQFVVNDGRSVIQKDDDASIQREVDRYAIAQDQAVTSWRRIDRSALPVSRAYRNAWSDSGKSIDHNMAKAREIHRAKVREARAPLLKALDVDYQRADESDDKMAKRAIAARKQLLRDATDDPRIDACQSIEELLALDVLSEEASIAPK